MSLVKWNDSSIFPSMNNVLGNFFRDDDMFFNSLSKSNSTPAVNVSETDEAFNLELAAPGKKKEDFKVEIDNNVLSISSENEESSEESGKNFTRKEYSFNSFRRTFRLPENVRNDEVMASYENGILKVEVPKTEPSKSETKTVEIK